MKWYQCGYYKYWMNLYPQMMKMLLLSELREYMLLKFVRIVNLHIWQTVQIRNQTCPDKKVFQMANQMIGWWIVDVEQTPICQLWFCVTRNLLIFRKWFICFWAKKKKKQEMNNPEAMNLCTCRSVSECSAWKRLQ